MKDPMKLKYDVVWAKPNLMNLTEMDYDLRNEWDKNEWRNQWVGLWYMKWMRLNLVNEMNEMKVARQICNKRSITMGTQNNVPAKRLR